MLRTLTNKIVLAVVIVTSAIFFYQYGKQGYTLYGDSLGYYMYLPATFIYHNIDRMADVPSDRGIDWQIMWSCGVMKELKTKTGKLVDQYTYGVALTELPFFLAAHGIERIRGSGANGFSATYQNAVRIASFVYAILGLVIVYRILTRFFSQSTSFLTVLILFGGTNLFWFALRQAGMSHTPLFFLYASLMYLAIICHDRPKTIYFILAGAASGLITVIRPTDILCLLIPLLYGVYNRATIQEQIQFIRLHRSRIAAMVVAFILPIIPQLLYWKLTTGDFVYYSYGDQTFHWKHPKIIEGLFFYTNGWLAYSPIMVFSLIGLLMYKQFRNWYWCILAVLPVYIYIIYSWYCYNYINGLGSRPMIHLYPLLALPLAAFLSRMERQKWYLKVLFAAVCLFFFSLNISYSIQESLGILKSPESNFAYNMQLLYRTRLRYDDLVVNDIAEWQPGRNARYMATLSCNNFDDSVNSHYVRDTVSRSRYCYRMSEDDYSPAVSVPYDKEKFAGTRWIRCSGRFMYTHIPDYFKHLMVLDIHDKLWKGCKIENKINDTLSQVSLDYFQTNRWGNVSFFCRLPHGLREGDSIKLFIWNFPRTELFVDNLCLEIYK